MFLVPPNYFKGVPPDFFGKEKAMHVWVLTTNCLGEMTSTVHPGEMSAIVALDSMVKDNWDEDAMGEPYEAFPKDGSRQIYFEAMEMDWTIQKCKMEDLPGQGEDVLLTPAMCEIIERALGNFLFSDARDILINHGEIPPDASADAGEEALDRIFAQIK